MGTDVSRPFDGAIAAAPKSSLPLSLQSEIDQHQEEFAADFSNLYLSIFPPKSHCLSSFSFASSPSSSATSCTSTDLNNDHRLIVEYQELCEQYDLCFSRLQALSTELETVRQENSELRLANTELLKLSSQAVICSSLSRLSRQEVADFSSQHAIEPRRLERRNPPTRTTLPKSISVRSTDYLKNQVQAHGDGGPGRQANRQRVQSQPDPGQVQQRVYVPAGGKGEEDALELEVYSQGTMKTELCEKWQETGTCPYGEHCQFAHGISELRPVIRHPRYKTEVCRMVLAGDTCPYGHRCHFRHSLTEQERLLVPR